jgi:hypothetical protein
MVGVMLKEMKFNILLEGMSNLFENLLKNKVLNISSCLHSCIFLFLFSYPIISRMLFIQ